MPSTRCASGRPAPPLKPVRLLRFEPSQDEVERPLGVVAFDALAARSV